MGDLHCCPFTEDPDPPTGEFPSTSVDISEQNVPETGEKFDSVEVADIVGEDSKTEEEVASQLEQKT